MPMTVIEDDMIFASNFYELHRTFLDTLNSDWDIVLWSSVLETFKWVDLFEGYGGATICYSSEELRADPQLIASISPRRQLYKLLHQFGTGCYTISPAGADKLLTRTLPLNSGMISFTHYFSIVTGNEGIDCAMCAVYPSLNAYTCCPPLAISDGSTSTTKPVS